MRILIAPDKFKGSLGAKAVGEAIAAGVHSVWPAAEIEVVALADGGEGTAEAIRVARGGETIACPAHDALARPIEASYAWLPKARLAVMEMSTAAGLFRLLPNELDPVLASTFGVGEMLRDVAARGAEQIIIGIGGSATNDGGFGMARALGFRFLASDGRELIGPVSDLLDLSRIEPPNEPFIPRVIAACDVENPLLGPNGATNVFSQQKGATPEQMEILERALTQLAEVAARSLASDPRDQPGAGAAGGLGFGLLTFCGATLRSGFEVVAEVIGLREKIRRADIVITGEGKLDLQTLAGKAPAGVARMARAEGKIVCAIAGEASGEPEVRQLFDAVIALNDTSESYRDTPMLLENRARVLAKEFQQRSRRRGSNP
jgi:glycerate kinase